MSNLQSFKTFSIRHLGKVFHRSPGWLVGTDPAIEDGEVHRKVCFSNFNDGCKYSESVKERIKKQKNKKTKTKNKKNKKTENERKKSEIAIF